jgi:hypothetical protein
MSEGRVIWCVRRESTASWLGAAPAADGWWVRKSERKEFDTRTAALEAAARVSAHNPSGVFVVKVTKKPRPKPVSREAWEGTVHRWAAYANQGAVLIGESNVAGCGPLLGTAEAPPSGLLARRLIEEVGKRVRVTLEVFP